MAIAFESKTVGNWLKYDQPEYSRELGVILAGSGAERALTNGMVLAKVTKGAASAAAVVGAGNGAMGAITVGADAIPGVYVLKIIEAASNAGDFQLEDPHGNLVGLGTVAVAFEGGGLSFTLADGATDFVVGDTIAITVAAGSGKYVQIAFDGTTGTEDAAGILYADKTAPDGSDVNATVVVRHAKVKLANITWPAGATDAQKAAAQAQLEAKGFVFE